MQCRTDYFIKRYSQCRGNSISMKEDTEENIYVLVEQAEQKKTDAVGQAKNSRVMEAIYRLAVCRTVAHNSSQ